jgi:hypothetical protein
LPAALSCCWCLVSVIFAHDLHSITKRIWISSGWHSLLLHSLGVHGCVHIRGGKKYNHRCGLRQADIYPPLRCAPYKNTRDAIRTIQIEWCSQMQQNRPEEELTRTVSSRKRQRLNISPRRKGARSCVRSGWCI